MQFGLKNSIAKLVIRGSGNKSFYVNDLELYLDFQPLEVHFILHFVAITSFHLTEEIYKHIDQSLRYHNRLWRKNVPVTSPVHS